MINFPTSPPLDVRADLAALRASLDLAIPPKTLDRTAIVSRCDVVALQEVKRDLGGLRLLMQALGPEWGWILTDLTRGSAGNQERMAFVFDLRRVRPSGLAAELVVPIETET